jgi:4-aminobutyrate aminotransferase-like enzyme
MNSEEVLKLLAQYESRNITFIEPDGSWPIVWKRAQGVHVWDAGGKKYLDLTAAFGVAAAGHANPRIVTAGQKQMQTLSHAMGDVHPHEPKARLARELSRLTFERWKSGRGKTIFGNSGFEAIEASLKTALLATKRKSVIAFMGGYHGVGYGALNATHRQHFRGPFRDQLREFGHFVPFPTNETPAALRSLESRMRKLFRHQSIGAVLAEPIQVRGGINIPPRGFLKLLRRLCDEYQALLILDEIYTGFGRTGKWFACEYESVAPDVICLGKALTGGFPLSACVGRSQVMDRAWPASTGEAIHTSTFLGNPVGCAMALAQIKEITRLGLAPRSAKSGKRLLAALKSINPLRGRTVLSARGLGLLAGIEIRHADGSPAGAIAIAVIKRLLREGFILLPEGEHANVISFTPPLTITDAQLRSSVRALAAALSDAGVNIRKDELTRVPFAPLQ